jgi:hypothetical protein
MYTIKEAPCPYLHPLLQKIVTGNCGANIYGRYWYLGTLLFEDGI